MNDVKLSGDELIAAERARQVLEHGHTIVSDARKNNNGQLILMAFALVEHKYQLAPDDWDPIVIERMMSKYLIERLIYAGALIAAEIDRLNLIRQIDETMKTASDGNENEDEADSPEVYN